MTTSPRLLILTLLTVLAAGCGSTQSNAGQPAQNADTLLATTHEAKDCVAAPADVVAVISAKLTGATLTHAFSGKSGTYSIVAGRLEGPGRIGSDVATFVLTDLGANATIYSIGGNATSSSSFQNGEQTTGINLNNGDVENVNACVKKG